ncbi:unnamed protein product [Symbiodinium natans]|uniref:Cytochrome b5 heme-binding domain-containing protein n=1 Tax=Symbiodinium natans TaxID=878477 RepID=A0A812HZ53_9DINO|nr:unnamed protein product [Symbiodinium natans]
MVVLLLGASHVSDGIRRLALERHESFNMSIPGSGALVLQILFSVPDILDDAVNFAGLETLGDVWLASERLTEHLLLPTGQHESLYNSAYELLDDPWPREDHVEVIVASDIIYGNWGETVGEALCRVLEPDGVIILAASEDRRGGMRCFQDSDCWVIVGDQVLDVTNFLADHPGGKKSIMMFAGKDATEEFDMLHDRKVIKKYGLDEGTVVLKGTIKK